MTKSTNYFKLGLFVTITALVALASAAALGARATMPETVAYHTFFNESVQGLDVGSPVKYRGVNIGVVCSTLGVLAIVFEGDAAKALNLHFGLGDVLVLASVLVWAFYTVFLRLRPGIAPTSFVAATFIIGAAAMAPLALGEWLAGETIRWGPRVWGAFAYVCVLPSIVSYFIFNSATRTVGPARAGQAITLMPLFGAVLSAALLGERLHSYHFAGMGLILAGIALSVLGGPRQEPAGAATGAGLEDRA